MQGKKVLVVDDDLQISAILSKHFADAGAEVTTAANFEQGLKAVKDFKPDIAVVDVMLPERSGLDLVKEVRAMAPPHPFFAVLTNSINADHIAEAMEAKVTIFIQKADHDPTEIVQMVQKGYAESK